MNHVLNWTVYKNERYENQKLDGLLKAVYFELVLLFVVLFQYFKTKTGRMGVLVRG